ncbi:unnamed protein product, partial [marine sediment metagenome]
KLLSTLMTINQLSIFSLDFNGKKFSDYIIDEFEINPLAITRGGELVAIDCICRFHKKTSYDIKPFESPNLTNLEK